MTPPFRERYGPWALVAGASVGLGAAFSTALARRGLNLLLIARNGAALDALGAELRARHGVEVQTAALDLGCGDLPQQVEALVGAREVGLLVYNAAHSLIGPFLQQPLDEQLRIVDINCRGPLVLARLLGARMAERRRGGILLMSSMAAMQGSPQVAAYAATKAFNLVLAEGLWDELEPLGVDVLACRAGATLTPGFERSQPQGKISTMAPEAVVDAALAALGRGPSMVPGWLNRAAAFTLGRLLPRRAAIRIMSRATRRLYPAPPPKTNPDSR